MATENLHSMISQSAPSKNDIVSLSLDFKLNIDKIMLSDETATSDNWLRILKWLNNFIKINNENDNNLNPQNIKIDILWKMLSQVENIPLVIFTKKGKVLENIHKISKNISLTIFTEDKKTATIFEFRANTTVHLIKNFNKFNNYLYIYNNIKKNKHNIFKNSKKALLFYVAFPRKNSKANSINLISKKDFI